MGRSRSREVPNEENSTGPSGTPSRTTSRCPTRSTSWALSPRAIAVYGYLLSIEDRQTYEAYASYNTIGNATRMSANTVSKYVAELEERQLIRTEHTTITTQDGRRRNGCLRYHILPIQLSIDQFYEKQLDRVDRVRERQRVRQDGNRKEAPQNVASGE